MEFSKEGVIAELETRVCITLQPEILASIGALPKDKRLSLPGNIAELFKDALRAAGFEHVEHAYYGERCEIFFPILAGGGAQASVEVARKRILTVLENM